MKPNLLFLATVSLFVALSQQAYGQGCKNYPYTDGIDADQISNNRYIATASATVSFDDADSVKDAREEATLEAKATIAKFLTETIQSDSAILKVVNESKKMSGAGKENVRNEAITRTKSLRNKSQALLRGVIVIGDCYTKGQEIRVTVGVKPETIAAAEGLAGNIGQSVNSQGHSGSSSSSGSTKQPLNGVDEYSNTNNLKKFAKPQN